MTRRRRLAAGAGAIALLVCAAITPHLLRAEGPARPRRVGWRVIELSTGRILDTQDADLLSRAVLPGSLMKLPALIASLESGAITPSTRVVCPGTIVVGGRRIGCQHPMRGHPLSAVEALALSCNVFFARASERLSREGFDRVLASFAWPTVPPSRALAVAASGVEGSPVLPGYLLAAWRQVLTDPPVVPMRSPTRKVVRDALAAAARYGTAAPFRARGVDALAKTGTSVTGDGRPVGLVLAAWPAARPARAALVIVEGGTGPDAAAIGAALAKGERPIVATPRAAREAPTSAPQPTAGPAPAPAPAVRLSPTAAGGMDSGVTIRVGAPKPGGTYVVRPLPLEDYVARVLAGEAAPRSSPAALEALAITARTFAFANRRRHARDGFDLCDSTHCQVLRTPSMATRSASDTTAGQVLAWQGAPASVFYTASCGGRTERPSAVWPAAIDPPYLPSRRDHGCGGEPKWTAQISTPDLHRALAASGYRGGQLRRVTVRERSHSGRVAALTLEGLTPGWISGQDFRMAVGRTLGGQVVKSTAFDLSRHRGTYTLEGHGYGHGVGFCVVGSVHRAAGGESRAALLKTYFPGLQVADYRTLRLPPAAVIPPADQPPPIASGQADPVTSTVDPQPAP